MLPDNPFTQSWIQSLTLAADNPVARTIKSKLDWIDHLSQVRDAADRQAAAQALWDYATSAGLRELLHILPTAQSCWTFSPNDTFLYARSEDGSQQSSSQDLETWKQALGLEPASFPLTAEVTHSDWMGLVRSEAVRLQKSPSMGAVPHTNTVHLPCTAHWDLQTWSVQFNQLDWIKLTYEDGISVPRPPLAAIEEPVQWAMSTANESLVVKTAAACASVKSKQSWIDCVPRLAPLHAGVVESPGGYAPWFGRAWSCVWPVVYREQNVLKGQADIGLIREEMKACLSAQPRLTVWMFLFAKLVCQIQLGMGLGFCGDFRD